MSKRMLIDANHPEETRVVVLDGQKVEEFDFESATKRPLKGNIYLAKVTRVEPSLQAAFVEYGGNRQGFLAFSEIHPDYYQIPVADREALLADAEADARRHQEEDFESFDMSGDSRPAKKSSRRSAADLAADEDSVLPGGESAVQFGIADAPEAISDADVEPEEDEAAENAAADAADETAESDPRLAEAQAQAAKRPSQRWMRKRHYKIQEVIKRRQIILVQVVKEERGNKGAALTTYLSLAGRYCVLMPNTPRGGGISRKITNATDRKRLKAAAQSLELPEGMGLIIRTAGGNRTKVEIRRDYEYLLRLWDTIRNMTLASVAPSCVYEEGNLVKRAIRDLYNKDVEEVLVEGDEGYHNAKDFMRMLMPSHAKNVKQYKETVPLFQHFHIEAQLDAMFSPVVTLKSGGYIVIDQTEALVAIDVNSGKATHEHSIEETATKTNLEAADEIGRQMRLRDLAGLVVIDYIDMEDPRNDRAVEKRTAQAVKNDRARIQIGKISQFGLLELSRQRLRAGVVAASTQVCPHCGGTGFVRSTESTSLRVLRGIEEEAQKQRADGLHIHVAGEVIIYLLNQKKAEIARVEEEYKVHIAFEPNDELKAGDFTIDRIGQREPPKVHTAVTVDSVAEPEIEAPVPEEAEVVEADAPEADENAQPRKRRRRRGGRGRRRGNDDAQMSEASDSADLQDSDEAATPDVQNAVASEPELDASEDGDEHEGAEAADGEQPKKRRRRRRGRRGGRNRNSTARENGSDTAAFGEDAPAELSSAPADVAPVAVYEDRFGRVDEIDTTPHEDPRPSAVPASETVDPTLNAEAEPDFGFEAEKPVAEPDVAQAPTAVKTVVAEPVTPAEPAAPAEAEAEEGETAVADTAEENQPVRRGWWQRTFRSDS